MGLADGKSSFTVYVLDRDPGVRHRVAELAESLGFAWQACASAAELRRTLDPDEPGCVVTEAQLADGAGVDLQQELRQTHSPSPVFLFVTDRADVKTAVQAMRAGAVDFLIKPVNGELLASRIREAEAKARVDREQAEACKKLAPLTERERTVLELIVRGYSTKEIAAEVFRSPKTIEAQRRSIMRKLAVSNLAQMVRVAVSGGTLPAGDLPAPPLRTGKRRPEATQR